MRKKIITDSMMAQGRTFYMLELARGSSHIASTRSPETLNRAIAEVLNGFSQVYDPQALGVFRELLALDVEQRGNQDAALAVRCFAPGLTDGKETEPSRARSGKSPDLSGGSNRPGLERAAQSQRNR